MLTKPTGPFASDGEIASKMEQWGDAVAADTAAANRAQEYLERKGLSGS